MIPIALQDRDSTGIIQDLVSKTASLMGNKLPSDAVHGKGHRKIDEGSGNEVGGAGADALRAARIHDDFEIVILRQEMTLRRLQNSPQSGQCMRLDG
jgi:hypothetical protein